MVTAILLEMPDDPINFMSTWCSQQRGDYEYETYIVSFSKSKNTFFGLVIQIFFN